MNRRTLLVSAGALAASPHLGLAAAASEPFKAGVTRVRPGDAAWPGPGEWDRLKQRVGGRLIKVRSPLTECVADPAGAACGEFFHNLHNPFYVGDDVGLTQTLGWTDAWTSSPSVWAVAARSSADVAAAVDFARRHRLRLVVKGGGHSFLGTSNAPDSLLIWTRPMSATQLHDAFVARGCAGRIAPQPAVSVGAGAMWIQAYDAVTTRGGRYVQGGGCTTVGVAGLVQGGGFGSFSKGYGTAAASLLEAEIVTADGVVRIANPCTNPDLFWAIKGGGGGTFGVITRLTLRTHALPPWFGSVQAQISATSDAAFRRLVERIMSFYRTSLLNPHWGDQITFGYGRRVSFSMLFQGIDQAEAERTWRPFFDWVDAAPSDYSLVKPTIHAVPARRFWDASFLKADSPGVALPDDRPGAPPENYYWAGDAVGVGSVVHAYQSAWLPSALLEPDRIGELADSLVKAAMTWNVALHCSKGIAGAAPDTVAAVKDTATNPAVLEAFALAISGSGGPPAYPGIVGHEAGLADQGHFAQRVAAAMAPIKRLLAAPASYVAESDYFEADWRTAYWGSNAARLEAIKERYDPGGLFFVHHGVGSERWSSDGFTRLA